MSRAVLPNFEKSQLVVAKTIDSEAQIIRVRSSMEYYFNELDATKFQRLVNSILNARFGVDTRLTPLRGADGGRDAETAPGNPYFEYQVDDVKPPLNNIFTPPRKGRYLFQVKHHRTGDTRISDVRQSVLSDFEEELEKNVLNRSGNEQVNYFFLITNVPSSKDSLEKLDKKRIILSRKTSNLHVDIWWKEQLIAFLDAMPNLWLSFPEIFAGGKVPFVAEVAGQTDKHLSRPLRIAINKQYERDSKVKFRQIDLENDLSKLFVDLDVNLELLSVGERAKFQAAEFKSLRVNSLEDLDNEPAYFEEKYYRQRILPNNLVSALGVLLCEASSVGDLKDVEDSTGKILLEGGPGQGKSTITQMAVQIYRSQILGKHNLDPDNRWAPPRKVRLPLRIELRRFAEWLSKNLENSVEQFLAHIHMIAASLTTSYDRLEVKFSDETSGLHKLISRLQAFYTGSVSKSFDFKEVYKFLSERFEPFYPYVNHSHPKYILVDSGRMISVSDAFLSRFINEKELSFDWLANIPLSNSIIKPLVSGCIKLNGNSLPKLLNSINNLFFAYHLPHASPILAQEVNRILKVARKEDSSTLLRGAFIAVSTSKFIKSAGSDLILKLIKNNYNDANLIANVLFKRKYRDPDEIDIKETEIISEVAKKILDNPDNYAFKVVCSAASYLFEREPLNLPPLIHEEEVLNLKVRKSIKS
ncbi:MAG: hypothetical protein M3N42_13645 [Cyanobacteriota bacterium]|nr:hypothetical protein [Cyanobacteriota bacterium]